MNYIEAAEWLTKLAGDYTIFSMDESDIEICGKLRDTAVLLRATGEREALLKELTKKLTQALYLMDTGMFFTQERRNEIEDLRQKISEVQTRMGA